MSEKVKLRIKETPVFDIRVRRRAAITSKFNNRASPQIRTKTGITILYI
jgi:hypothetical protein